VHANLICSVSHFFEKTFNGGCAEGTENKMNLPEDESETVSMFVAWLYNKRELVFDRKSCVSSSGTRGFIDLFVFIDAKQCNPLKNTVLGTLQDTLCCTHISLTGRGDTAYFREYTHQYNILMLLIL